MKVENHREFASTDYPSGSCPFYQLGEVVINKHNEIGIIIQVHSQGEYRTDMFGNVSANEITLADMGQIKKFRANLLRS